MGYRRIHALVGLLLCAGLLAPACTRREATPPPLSSAAAAASPGLGSQRAGADTPALGERPPVAPRPPSPAPIPTRPPLPARLRSLLSDARVEAGGRVGLAVIDDAGGHVFGDAAGEPFLPASTEKLLTAAAALGLLGPEFRYTTRVHATTALQPDGTLPGDLVVVGSGDPALATPLFGARFDPARPRTPLESLADQLVAAGLRHLSGGVLGDPSVFAHQPAAPGWSEHYFDDLDATPVSGLTSEAGRKLELRAGRLLGVPAPDPAAETAASLIVLLQERGVAVGGGAASTRMPPPASAELASVSSPPLRDLLQYAVQRSDNHMADAIFRTLGALDGTPTWTGSTAAVQGALAPLGLDWAGVSVVDGSGLSRDNRMTPVFLARLIAGMRQSNLAGEWDQLMAVSAESGTLRRRLHGTVAAHRLRGKTGSLGDVRSLAGSVVGPPGAGALHFALLANGQQRDAMRVIRTLQDDVVVALAEQLYDCVVVPETPPAPPPSAAPPGPPPAPVPVLRCRY